jgi:hypothetical protein
MSTIRRSAERPAVLADDPAFLAQLDPIGVGADLHRAPDRARGHRVPVVVEAHQAGPGDRRRHRVEATEPAGIGDQARALRLEHLPYRPILELGVTVRLGVGDRLIQQPSVELLVALHAEPRAEEALAHEADLVLDLSLLPT